MKSPFTGGKTLLLNEKREFEFRGNKFPIKYHFYRCVDTGEEFTDTELDELNLNQVYNQYREKESIPFPDEIIAYRKQYELSATKMSQILGFGVNMYAKYESGEMPNVSNGRMINICKEPAVFKNYFERIQHQFDEKENKKILQKIEKTIEHKRENIQKEFEKFSAIGKTERGIYTGYISPNLEKMRQLIVYFSQKCQPFVTKMNKLLFYSDFLHFKRTGVSITGMSYQAIAKGPVPMRYDDLYANATDIVEKEDIFYPNDVSGERFITNNNFDASIFNDKEIETLEMIIERFKNTTTKEIVEISHTENAWIENEKDKNTISYNYAFDLKAFEMK